MSEWRYEIVLTRPDGAMQTLTHESKRPEGYYAGELATWFFQVAEAEWVRQREEEQVNAGDIRRAMVERLGDDDA